MAIHAKNAAALSAGIFIILALPATAGQLGIGINGSEAGGTFVDMAKENYRWSTGGRALTAAQIDSAGWPKVDAEWLFDGRPVAEWTGQIDDPDGYRLDYSGAYNCAFTGQAVVVGGGGTVRNLAYDSASNTTTFEFVVAGPPGPGHGFLTLRFTGSKRAPQSAAGSGITGLRMLRPGYALNVGKTFTDEFLAALTALRVSAVRFMDFTGTNTAEPLHPALREWNTRKLKTDASQDPIDALGKIEGSSWEYVLELANQVKMDPWINVPLSASPDYLRKLAAFFKDGLDPSLNLYVESGNEVWNNIFPQHAYNVAEAGVLKIGEQENHARRTVELAQAFGTAFGPGSLNKRVRVVLCSHAPMLKWWVEPMLQYVQKTFGPPSDYLWGIACQMYFTVDGDAGAIVPKLLADAHASIVSQIDDPAGTNQSGRKQWIAKAAAYKLPGGFLSYEGGPHPPLGKMEGLANRIRAERDSGMGKEIKFNYGPGFLDLGGTLAMHFILSSPYQRYGCFGLTDDIRKPNRNYKYRALKEAAAASGTLRPQAMGPQGYLHVPLPFRPGAIIRFRSDRGVALLRIFGPSGRMLAELGGGSASNGMREAVWDGKAEGSPAPAGLYWVRMEMEGSSTAERLLFIP